MQWDEGKVFEQQQQQQEQQQDVDNSCKGISWSVFGPATKNKIIWAHVLLKCDSWQAVVGLKK